MSGDAMTVEKRILIHLRRYSRFAGDYVCPPEITQSGISEALGIRRSHASYTLSLMKERGEVE